MALRTLRVRSVLFIATIYAVVGALSLAAFIMVARELVERFGQRYVVQHAELNRNRILGPLHRELALARKLANSAVLRDWLRQEDSPSAKALALRELEGYRELLRDGSWFFIHDRTRNYYFNNAQDEFRGRELRYVLDPSDPTMSWYGAAMRDIEDYAFHVDHSTQLGLHKVWINVVVRAEGRKVGLTGTGLDLTTFVHEIVQGRDSGAMTVLVDAQGTIQAHPDAGLMAYNAQMKDERQRIRFHQRVDVPEQRVDLEARLARLAKTQDSVETFHLMVGGKRYLAAATGLRDLGWVGLVLVDPSQVMGMRAFLPILALLVGSLVVTIVLVSILFHRLVLKPLAALTASTQAIAAGSYGITLPVDRPDEIGQLTESFNHMTSTVRDYTAHLEEKVASRTHELQVTLDRLAASNRKLLDSLEVAHLLQSSLLPDADRLRAALPDHFVVYRPRDQVGGDFYAFFEDAHGCLLAVGDCTGHGVPGALMSMSARAVLEQVLSIHGADHPALLLHAFNRTIKTVLHQEEETGSGPDNGLDLALLRIPHEGDLSFASARIPLLILRSNGSWEEIPGDREGLGYRRSPSGHPFQLHAITLGHGDALYLTTDGLLDQAGGTRGFGFGRLRLRALLDGLRTLPMARQKVALEQALAAYQGEHLQRDDITVFGLKHPRLESPC